MLAPHSLIATGPPDDNRHVFLPVVYNVCACVHVRVASKHPSTGSCRDGRGGRWHRRRWGEGRGPAITPQYHIQRSALIRHRGTFQRHNECEVAPTVISAVWCASRFIHSLVRFWSKQGVAERGCWWPVLPVKWIGPKQINPNIILVVVRRSMKRLLIFPWNKTLLYICLSVWSNPLMLTKCQKYHADRKNGLSVFGSYVIHSGRRRQDSL